MTLYDAPGPLLGQISEVMEAALATNSDPAVRNALRVLRRLATVTATMPRTLARENEILGRTLDAALDALAGAGHPVPPPALPDDDPAGRYRILLATLDDLVTRLHEHEGQAWAIEARRAIRRGIVAASEVQADVVDAAFAT